MKRITLKSVVSTGKIKTVNIYSEGLQNCRVLKLTILFDPAVVKPLCSKMKCTVPGMWATAIDPHRSNQLNLSWATFPPENFPNKKVCIKLPFQKVSNGVSKLIFDDTTTDFGCRIFIGNSEYPDDEKTYISGQIQFKIK